MGEPISAADALIQQVVSEAEMLTLASAGLLFVWPLMILKQLADGDLTETLHALNASASPDGLEVRGSRDHARGVEEKRYKPGRAEIAR